MGAEAAVARFNLFTDDFRADPYPMYRSLRAAAPVHRTMGMWVLTRHAEVRAVLRDRDFAVDVIPEMLRRQAARLSVPDVEPIDRLGRTSLVFTGDPAHARLRALVNSVFTAAAVARLRPRVAVVAEHLTKQAWRRGGMDLITDFAGPLPVLVLCDWLGLPTGMRHHVAGWTHDIRFLLEPGLMTATDFERVHAVVDEFTAAMHEVIGQRRARPGDDLISRLLAARVGGDRLRDDELACVGIMCFVAGVETTKSLIGNAVLALLRYPEQYERLRAQPELLGPAVAETLRYDSPLQHTKRRATRDIPVADQVIHSGEQVLLCLGAANRDPAAFPDPDTFDITRDTAAHVAFGHGLHGCLGAPLAQLQAEIALGCLLGRPERLAADTDRLRWQDHSFLVRGLRTFPVTVESR
ncbi:cytochrome P450 [Nocardia farcinica]|uniref:cytochrome P450 n=1 Tax=Nocardia farcinica TaxID=37329 RepID=UPI001894BAA0|nr:cytochrome P450 [Nocardia farcinica]MBF6383872.1 cytochrome P450 [Nocardia farcinica]